MELSATVNGKSKFIYKEVANLLVGPEKSAQIVGNFRQSPDGGKCKIVEKLFLVELIQRVSGRAQTLLTTSPLIKRMVAGGLENQMTNCQTFTSLGELATLARRLKEFPSPPETPSDGRGPKFVEFMVHNYILTIVKRLNEKYFKAVPCGYGNLRHYFIAGTAKLTNGKTLVRLNVKTDGKFPNAHTICDCIFEDLLELDAAIVAIKNYFIQERAYQQQIDEDHADYMDISDVAWDNFLDLDNCNSEAIVISDETQKIHSEIAAAVAKIF